MAKYEQIGLERYPDPPDMPAGHSCDCEEDGQQQHTQCAYCDGDADCCRQDEASDWICRECWPLIHPHATWGDESDPIHPEGCPDCDAIEAANAEFMARANAILAGRK